MNVIDVILNWALLIIVAISVLASALIGLGRGLKKSVASTVVIVLAAIVSFIVTLVVAKPSPSDTSFITQKIMGLFNDSSFAEVFEIPSARDTINYYISMLIAPFVFVLLFAVLRIIFGIIMKTVLKQIKIMDNISPVAKRLGGAGVGLANGIILCLIFCMPLLGTLDVANSAMTQISAGDSEVAQTVETVQSYVSPIVDQGAGNVMLKCGGSLMYNGLASADYYGHKVKFKDEVTVVSEMAGELMSAEGDDAVVTAVDSVVEGIEKSYILQGCAADVLSNMSHSWREKGEFMGIQKISVGEWFDPVIDICLDIFETEDKEHINGDLKSISAFVHQLDNYELLSKTDYDGAVLDCFKQEGTFANIVGSIEDNDRMLPLVDEVNRLGIKVFADDLGFMASNQENYNILMRDIANTLNTHASGLITREQAKADLKYHFDGHGIEIDDIAGENVTEGLLNEFAGDSNITPDRVHEFFALYSAVANSTLVENEDGSLSADGEMLKHYTKFFYKQSYAYALASGAYYIGKAGTLASAKTMESVLVTTEEIIGSIVSYSSIENRHAETENLDAVMVYMVNSYDNFGNDKIHASEVMDYMGIVLDKMGHTAVYHDTTDKFLTAIMQSHKVSDSIGLTISEMTDFAHKISDGRTEETGYEQISVTVSQTFDVLESIHEGTAPNEDKREHVSNLMKDLTPDTAKVIQDVSTPSLMQNYGVQPDKAEQTSNAVGTLFGNMSNYTEAHPQGDMTDDEYKASIDHEAEAVNKIITLAMKANEDKGEDKTIFNTADGQQGAVEMSATDVVDLFVTSDVAVDTTNELVNGKDGTENNFDPMGVQSGLSASDKEDLVNALDAYAAENGTDNGIGERLENIGALFGVEYNAG
ncbi:MAG: CvpA family protein [Ruminococcaceae bacterium]|nr:CvpA family protein [Oscillospiraceae bacterium]